MVDDDSASVIARSVCRRLRGTIVRRRILGRSLAFADISVRVDGDDSEALTLPDDLPAALDDDHAANGPDKVTDRIISLIFQRHVVLETVEFPVKKASLPFGAIMEVTCWVSLQQPSTSKTTTPWDVISWKLLTNPFDEAIAVAAIQNGGISCTDYLQSRGEAFERAKAMERSVEPQHAPSSSLQQQIKWSTGQSDNGSVYSNEEERMDAPNPLTISSVHGNPRAKGLRAKIFADFIVDNLLQLDGTDRVLDVAGGKGQLSLALAALGIPCTVVDLLQRKQNSSGLRTTVKQLQRQKRPIPTFVTQPFPIMPLSSSSQEPCAMIQSLVDAHTCLVGLHPDQCTEAILDVALRHNKSVAIVPCCVFPSLFPMRMIPSINKLAKDAEMKPVQTYDDFLVYLLCKDARLRRATLPFEGKNECIYMKTSLNETDS
jgi:hypothetical protein